jgi:Taurine catabolism dioxygenase TauD, TfdA family
MTMNAVLSPRPSRVDENPFDLDDVNAYGRWRAHKLAQRPKRVEELIVDVADPAALGAAERDAMLACCERANMVVYRSAAVGEARSLPTRLGHQLGLHRLDTHWLADEDGVSRITVSDTRDERGGFIPYTDRPIRWHTDGYYHPGERRIRAMILHCVRPARSGGANALLDHELVYVALRDASPAGVRALMAADAMTIPARADDDGVARPAQSGPVFAVDPHDGTLQMRYTARTRSIEWKTDAATRAAVAMLEAVLAGDGPDIFRLTLEPGMGIVANNVLHERTAFTDDPLRPRLLYRARYLDRIATREAACRIG